MDRGLRDSFTQKWEQYFGAAGLPLAFYYTDEPAAEDLSASRDEARCLIGNLARVRQGQPYVLQAGTPGCAGGKRYTGFSQTLRPDFEYFLSCGIPGRMEGERYKKSPELVREYLKNHPPFVAPARYLVFKRWDRLEGQESPLAVIFFAGADVLSGLFTLANFDLAHSHGVIAPMGSGCSSIVEAPLIEARSGEPRCVLGMFDISARPDVPAQTLTFSVPIRRFETMAANMDESFLSTASWAAVRERIGKVESPGS
ncbi:MAG: DUF169 domain-containing protein [Chloroflexota bacterium]